MRARSTTNLILAAATLTASLANFPFERRAFSQESEQVTNIEQHRLPEVFTARSASGVPTLVSIFPGYLPMPLDSSAELEVTLSEPAGAAGVEVSLDLSPGSSASVPPSVTVIDGETTARFLVLSSSSPGQELLTAALGGDIRTATIEIIEGLIFYDGFELGDTSAWSLTVPDLTFCPDDGLSRYAHDQALSPITSCVATRMQTIVATSPTPADDVFMKIGASGSIAQSFLRCFSDPSYDLDLDGRVELQPTIDFFVAGDADGSTPFERDSLAVGLGRTASWAITGTPSPLEQEITAINSRSALIDFGTNDMEMGATYGAALFPFYESMHSMSDELEAGGIAPIVTGLNPRADLPAAALWVPTYDVVSRGIAEQRQLPYLSLYRSMVDLPDMGLLSDGIHGNTYQDPGSGAEPCVFTEEALQFNYNLRNLRTLERLDSVRRIALNGGPASDVAESWSGTGAATSPFVVDRLPFTHSGDTGASPHDAIDSYPSCTGSDMSGPEFWYRIEVASPLALRVVALDREDVDVDVFLISGPPSPDGCILTGGGVLDTTLSAGEYHIAVDTFVAAGVPQSGRYLLTVLQCEAGDPDCLD